MEKLEKSGFFGKGIYYVEVITSTQDYLLENHHQHQAGDIIWARQQTRGRGRKNNVWHSQADKSLLYSYLLPIKDYALENLSQVIALSLSYYLREFYGLETRVKWPNDVFKEGKKISGVLIETVGDYLVVGHGVNVLNDDEFCSSIEKGADSVFSNTITDLKSFFFSYIPIVEKFLMDYSKNGFKPFYEMWCSIFLWDVLGQRILLSIDGDRKEEVEIQKLLPTGQLEIKEVVTGEVKVISSGEVFNIGGA